MPQIQPADMIRHHQPVNGMRGRAGVGPDDDATAATTRGGSFRTRPCHVPEPLLLPVLLPVRGPQTESRRERLGARALLQARVQCEGGADAPFAQDQARSS